MVVVNVATITIHYKVNIFTETLKIITFSFVLFYITWYVTDFMRDKFDSDIGRNVGNLSRKITIFDIRNTTIAATITIHYKVNIFTETLKIITFSFVLFYITWYVTDFMRDKIDSDIGRNVGNLWWKIRIQHEQAYLPTFLNSHAGDLRAQILKWHPLFGAIIRFLKL